MDQSPITVEVTPAKLLVTTAILQCEAIAEIPTTASLSGTYAFPPLPCVVVSEGDQWHVRHNQLPVAYGAYEPQQTIRESAIHAAYGVYVPTQQDRHQAFYLECAFATIDAYLVMEGFTLRFSHDVYTQYLALDLDAVVFTEAGPELHVAYTSPFNGEEQRRFSIEYHRPALTDASDVPVSGRILPIPMPTRNPKSQPLSAQDIGLGTQFDPWFGDIIIFGEEYHHTISEINFDGLPLFVAHRYLMEADKQFTVASTGPNIVTVATAFTVSSGAYSHDIVGLTLEWEVGDNKADLAAMVTPTYAAEVISESRSGFVPQHRVINYETAITALHLGYWVREHEVLFVDTPYSMFDGVEQKPFTLSCFSGAEIYIPFEINFKQLSKSAAKYVDLRFSTPRWLYAATRLRAGWSVRGSTALIIGTSAKVRANTKLPAAISAYVRGLFSVSLDLPVPEKVKVRKSVTLTASIDMPEKLRTSVVLVLGLVDPEAQVYVSPPVEPVYEQIKSNQQSVDDEEREVAEYDTVMSTSSAKVISIEDRTKVYTYSWEDTDAAYATLLADIEALRNGSGIDDYDVKYLLKWPAGLHFKWSDWPDAIPAETLVIDGEAVGYKEATLETSEGSFGWTCTVALSSPQDRHKFSVNKRMYINLQGDTYVFVVDSVLRSRTPIDASNGEPNETVQVTGLSPTAVFSAPRANTVTRNWTRQLYVTNILAELLGEDYPVQWDVLDWVIPANRYGISSASPMECLQEVVEACGGVVGTLPNGVLHVRYLHPTPVDTYGPLTAQSVITEDVDVFSSSEQYSAVKEYNAFRVMDAPAAADNVVIEYESITATTGYVRVYPTPWNEAVGLRTTTAPIASVVAGTDVTEIRSETETVEVVDGKASVKYPVYTVENVEFIGKNLLGVTVAPESTEVTTTHSTEKYSLLKITYTTRCRRFNVTGRALAKAQFVAGV